MSDGGQQSNWYNNPNAHNPLASGDEIIRNERPWYVPPPPPPPTQYTPPPVYYNGRAGSAAAPGQWAPPIGRSAGGFISSDFGLNLVLVGFLWEIWVFLYPLPTAAAYLSLVVGIVYLQQFVPRSSIFAPGLYAVALDFIIAAIVLWTVSRWEHRLAHFTAYRILRHLVRLTCAAFAGGAAMRVFEGVPVQLAMNTTAILADRKALIAGAIAAVAAHFLLWNFTAARNWWHRRLIATRLRPIGV